MPERRSLLAAAALCALPAFAQTPSLVELIRVAKPSVVLIGTYSETDSPRFQVQASGFVVGDGRTVVTNAHALPPPDALPSERRVVAQVWQGGRDWLMRETELISLARPQDLALLRLRGAPLAPLRLAGEGLVAEGTEIALIGFPIASLLGAVHTTHRGIVSSVTGVVMQQPSAQTLTPAAVRQMREGNFDIYQLDATAYPGNSGGPVFDLATGQVIAVLSSGSVKGNREAALSNPTGISYALPIKHVLALLKQSQSP